DVLGAVVAGVLLADVKIVEAVELGIGGVAAVGAQAGDGDGGEAAIDVGRGGARHGEAVEQVVGAVETAAREPELDAVEERRSANQRVLGGGELHARLQPASVVHAAT